MRVTHFPPFKGFEGSSASERGGCETIYYGHVFSVEQNRIYYVRGQRRASILPGTSAKVPDTRLY